MVVPLNTTKILLILLIYSVVIGFYVVQKNEADSGSFFQPIPVDIPIDIQSKMMIIQLQNKKTFLLKSCHHKMLGNPASLVKSAIKKQRDGRQGNWVPTYDPT